MIKKNIINFEYIKLEINEYEDLINQNTLVDQKSMMTNVYKSLEIGKMEIMTYYILLKTIIFMKKIVLMKCRLLTRNLQV
jgi:hypothetical protein